MNGPWLIKPRPFLFATLPWEGRASRGEREADSAPPSLGRVEPKRGEGQPSVVAPTAWLNDRG
jgi:hypothetical protein